MTFAEEVVAGFDDNLPEQERVLAQAALNAEQGIRGNSTVWATFTALDFFALSVDYDMRVLLRTLLAHPQSRLTAEKFLALCLEEADESVDKMFGHVLRAIRTATDDDPAAGAFDFEAVRQAKVHFGIAMAGMRADTEFNETLRVIRNTVAAHVVGDDVGIQNGVIWVRTRQAAARDGDGVLRSQVVQYATQITRALNEVSRALRGAILEPGVVSARLQAAG